MGLVIARTSRPHSPDNCLEFEDLYRTHYDFVWRTLRRMGVSARDVNDAGQNVFLTAFQRLSTFEGRSSLETWLCGITLRVASDYRRSAISRREVLVDETPFSASSDAGQFRLLEQQERLVELDAVLSELPIEQRTVLVLFVLEEMPGEDIAKLLGVPEGTVRSRLRLARRAFSKLVAAREDGSVRQVNSLRLAAGGGP